MHRMFLLPILATPALAACICGFSVNNTETSLHHATFTDLFETDFLHLQAITPTKSYTTGWLPQNYTQPPTDGPYGIARQSSDAIPNPSPNRYLWSGPGVHGGDPGLQLWVRSHLVDDSDGDEKLVPSAELVSQRADVLYGSFRIAAKTTRVSGTCGAFFFYRNDSQEVDVEVLSKSQRVHFVVQSTDAAAVREGRGDELAQQRVDHSAGPEAEYNEYRFDWLPDRIEYYINSRFVWATTESIPSTPGRIHISHWSNGNPLWTGGPPSRDAVMTVSYVKAYFNSSNATRVAEYSGACAGEGSRGEVCQIPDQTVPPNPFGADGNVTGRTFFFTAQGDLTNQTVYDGPFHSGGRAMRLSSVWATLSVILGVGSFIFFVGVE